MRSFCLIVAMAIAFVSCDKPNEPIRFSILGDSYSSFDGYVRPDSNNVYYPNNSNDVTTVDQMWWWQMADSTGWQLEKNNSFSGSFVCNMNHLNYFGPHSFLRRMDNLGNPDVIFVFGGTNDAVYHAPLGEYVFDNWDEDQLITFRPALACLFNGLMAYYPEAKLYFVLDLSLDDAYIASSHRIAQYYDVECVDLYGIEKILNHPTIAGQATIANQVLEALEQDGVIF